jgi:serine/threonine protein kinase
MTDKYAFERVLGRGGMGTIFEARHARLGHRVAIKVLGDDLRIHDELVRRFEREARAASALSSPHAVRVYDIDTTTDGAPFFVMELLSGRDLAQILEVEGRKPVGRAVRWIVEACDAIAEAHHLGIVHRDIKPSNLILCDSGVIKVLDFGIAKKLEPSGRNEAAITSGLAPLGTPQYMSPEQVRCAKTVDARSDIWSLGVTLYELVAGRPPFDHEVPQACIAAIVADPIPPPSTFVDIPAGLEKAIMRALEKNAGDRFATVEDFVDAIVAFADVTPAQDGTTWRALPTRKSPNHEVTLDGDDLIPLTDDGEPALELLRVSRPVETVPPAFTRTTAGARGKRIRSSLALAFAATLGLGALVATPRCVGSRLEPAWSAASIMRGEPLQSAHVILVPKAEVHVAPEVVVTRADAPTVKSAAPKAKTVRPPQTSQANPPNGVRFVGPDMPVHGGISNPGF